MFVHDKFLLIIYFTYFFQLWLVFHICSRICLSVSALYPRLHPKANGKPMEDLCETLCCPYGFTWTHQRVSGLPKLPSATHVQIHKGN